MAESILVVGVALCISLGIVAFAAWGSSNPAIVLAVFLLHLIVGATLFSSSGLYVPDAHLYDEYGKMYADYWSGSSVGASPTFAAGKEGWVMILGATYWIFGHHPFVGILINCVAAAVTCRLLMATMHRMGWGGKANSAGIIFLLMPAFAFWSSLLLRESTAWLLTALAVWAGAGLVRSSSWRDSMALVGAISGLLWIRGTVALVIGVGVIVGAIFSRRRVPVPLVVALGIVAAVGGPLLARVSGLLQQNDLAQVNASRASLSTAGSGFATQSYGSLGDVLRNSPLSFARAALGPFPWELSSVPTTAAADLVGWLLLLLLAVRGIRRAGLRASAVFTCAAVLLIFVIGATSGNYGTLIRLRAQAAVALVPLAAVGLGGRVRRSADPAQQADRTQRQRIILRAEGPVGL